MNLSVIIPTLNEAEALPNLLGDLRQLGGPGCEVLVADGGSSDSTVRIALAGQARIVPGGRGRARQLNAGARSARGDWLLFLHADSRVGAEARAVIRDVVAGRRALEVAVFRFAIDLPPRWRRLIETGQAIREVLFGLAYGDQGLLIRREAFWAVGGYPELPLMEDVAMLRRLRARYRVVRLPAPLFTSGRRYRQHGILRTWLTHAVLIALYGVGVSPARLARWRDGKAPLVR
jgi:rSAM/selenodomain-associated transferase 2